MPDRQYKRNDHGCKSLPRGMIRRLKNAQTFCYSTINYRTTFVNYHFEKLIPNLDNEVISPKVVSPNKQPKSPLIFLQDIIYFSGMMKKLSKITTVGTLQTKFSPDNMKKIPIEMPDNFGNLVRN